MTQIATQPLRVDSDAARGRGVYPAFHALWPLAEMGVVSDLSHFRSEGWDRASALVDGGRRRTRVALVDTSVAADHPNLKDAIDTTRAIDFFAARHGVPADAEALSQLLPKAAMPKGLPSAAEPFWDALHTHLASPAPAPTGSVLHSATAPSFSAHGTAMAGLIGARPVGSDAVDVAGPQVFNPKTGELTAMPGGSDVAFAFAGVDPFCQIVPISTHFDPEPEQLILAMLYAVMIGADVITLARDFPSPESLAPEAGKDLKDLRRALGVELSETEIALWSLLGELTVSISKTVPVICAGGNGAQEQVLFPGDLAAADNGIIAVGARTAAGQPASYTPPSTAITVYAPSGDGERLDVELQRLDVQSAGYNPHDHGSDYRPDHGNFGDVAGTDAVAGMHAPQDLVSTDVPGRAGYNSSPNAQVFGKDGAVLDYRSAFCRFSGTSGAVALVTGLVSLGVSSNRLKTQVAGAGANVKAALTGNVDSDPRHAEPAVHWRTLPPEVRP